MILGDASTSRVLFIGVLVGVLSILLGFLFAYLLRRLFRRLGISILDGPLWRSPVVLTTVLAGLSAYNRLVDREWADQIAAALSLGLIAAVAWLFVVLAFMLEKGALAKFPQTDIRDLDSRHARTQITMIRRVVVSLIVAIAVGAILWSFPVMRQLGLTVLASAGVLGIIAGLAAQTTLGNVFAGLQIAFTDAIRMGDIVVIDEQWGRVEEITLTYVVIRLTDRTSKIVPSTFFTTNQFGNWTHAGVQVVSQVDVAADWSVSPSEVREELRRTVEGSKYWDGDLADVVVQESTDTHLVLRALVSAARGDDVDNLQWEVQEALVTYLQQRPGAVPRARSESWSDGDSSGGRSET